MSPMFDGASPSSLVLSAVVAYLLGAVPVGFFVARAFGIGDIRRHGSGTIGMTNVLRTAGKMPAVLTLIGDVVKGMLAVWLGAHVAGATSSLLMERYTTTGLCGKSSPPQATPSGEHPIRR